jgi:hypothetical protein
VSVVEYIEWFFATPFGKATSQFFRVFAAAALAAWSAEGLPLSGVSLDTWLGFVELGFQAGISLVLVNYFAPWEKRFGRLKDDPAETWELQG